MTQVQLNNSFNLSRKRVDDDRQEMYRICPFDSLCFRHSNGIVVEAEDEVFNGQ